MDVAALILAVSALAVFIASAGLFGWGSPVKKEEKQIRQEEKLEEKMEKGVEKREKEGADVLKKFGVTMAELERDIERREGEMSAGTAKTEALAQQLEAAIESEAGQPDPETEAILREMDLAEEKARLLKEEEDVLKQRELEASMKKEGVKV